MRRRKHRIRIISTPAILTLIPFLLYLSSLFLAIDGGSTLATIILKHIEAASLVLTILLSCILFRKNLSPLPLITALSFCIILYGELYFIHRRIAILLYAIHLVVAAGYFFVLLLSHIKKLKRIKGTEKEPLERFNINAPLFIALLLFVVIFAGCLSHFISLEQTVFTIHNNYISWIVCGVLAMIGVLLYILLDRYELMPKKEGIFSRLFLPSFSIFLLSFIILFLTSNALNYGLDFSEGEKKNFEIVERDKSSSGRRFRYFLTIAIDGEEEKLTVPRTVYQQHPIGSYITVCRHEGAFGVSYYEYHMEELYSYDHSNDENP